MCSEKKQSNAGVLVQSIADSVHVRS